MSERGSVTLWMLGLSLALLSIGGLAIDLWLLAGERRELAALVDAASVAAASGIDEARWRSEGVLVIEPELAREHALGVLARHPAADDLVFPPDWLVVGGEVVEVRLERSSQLALLRLLGADQVTVRASARSVAELRG